MINSPQRNLVGRHILVVEDDESSAFLYGEILKGTGMNMHFVSDGEQAVSYIRKNPDTDLVLMDVHLPVKDGFTATKEIKAISNQIKVIAQTAYAISVDRHEAKRAGCDGFVTKPVNPGVLIGKMSSLLE